MRWLGLLLLAVLILGGARYAFEGGTPPGLPTATAPAAAIPSAPKEKTPQEIAADAQMIRDVMAVRKIKATMKNPASFTLEQALRMDDKALCLTYRATNSFNAVVPGFAVATATRIITSDQDGFQAAWDRSCKGRRGDDVTYIRLNL